MTDMTTDLATALSARASLEDDVRQAGIPIINQEQIVAHMKKKVAQDCPTPIHKGINIVTHLFRYLNLRLLFKFILPELPVFLHRMMALFASVALLLISMSAVQMTGNPMWFILSIPMATWIVSCSYTLYAQNFIQTETGTLTWEQHTLSSFALDDILIPNRLKKRIDWAHRVPKSKVMILADSDVDPFLMLQRGFGPWKEKVAIGAWNTGTDMDNI